MREAGHWPLRVAIFGAAVFVLAPVAARLAVVPPVVGFLGFVAGGLIGLFNSIAGVLVFRHDRRRGILIMALSEIPALALVFASLGGIGKPLINDITTDVDEPPILVSAMGRPANHGRDMVYPEAFSEQQRSAYPDVKPLHLKDPPDAVFQRALAVARRHPGWEIDSVNEPTRTFEGVATSRIFGFQDDFAVRVRPDESGSVVDMRSKSRDGKGDLGANAARIRIFLDELARDVE
jgi:uncharacterized protein (DUF1499 family)